MADCWLLMGPEKGKKKAKIKEIFSIIQEKAGEKPEIHRFYPFETEVSDILSIASNGSLFASHLLLVINQAETIKSKEATLLANYLKDTKDEVSLILISEESSVSKISAAIVKQVPKSNKIIFWELFESDKRAWLNNFFRKQNISLASGSVEFILEMLENNTIEFKNICDQLALFFEPGAELTPKKLEEYLYHSKEESVFTLFDRIAGGDFQGALDVLKKIQLSGIVYYPQLVGGLVWQLKKLYQFSSLLTQHYSKDDIFKQMGIRAKKAKQNYTRAAKLYKLNQLKQMLILCTQVDSQLRSGRSEIQRLQMELFLYQLIVKKGEARVGERL